MKVSGSYSTLVSGVSEQVPSRRLGGQHTEQVNMIPDPVVGLCRRPGSVMVAEALTTWSESALDTVTADTASWRTFKYESNNVKYVLLVRRGAKTSGSPAPAVIGYNETTGEFLTLSRPVTDAVLDALEAGGCSAITNIGKYVFLAGNTIVPQSASVNAWEDTNNQKRAVVWIRGGAYSRTYKVTVTKSDNSVVSFEYTTPAAAYPGLLDTSMVSELALDTSGGTPPTTTAPTTAAVYEYLSEPPSQGATHTLTHAGSIITGLYVTYYYTESDTVYSGSYIQNVHYTFNSATGVITWLFTETILPSGWIASGTARVTLTYRYQTAPGGTTVSVLPTATDTEPLAVFQVVDKGVADLSWAKWNPASLTVKDGVESLTNVYPSATPGPGQFSWGAGDGKVIFHESYVGNNLLSATYTHTKTVVNPNYAKIVADMTTDYQREVTAWIASAAAAIAPESIVLALKDAAWAAGLSASVGASDSTLWLVDCKALTVQDGGDGSLIRGVANEVASVDEVSAEHYVGKIVKVRAAGSEEVFYLKAVPKDPTVTTGFTPVSWEECAGVVHTLSNALVYCTVVGSTLYLASSATLLATLTPGPHPDYAGSVVGDADTSPVPYFVGRKISYLGVFQDRLLIGAGAVLRASRIGDYLNFFRSSVLTVADGDPIEVLSQGSEDDELRFSVLYDRDLVIFGRDRQYVVSGREPFTPTSANMPVMSSHEGAGDVPPVTAGALLFYSKRGPRSSNVYQVQPGKIAESPESFSISTQVATYLAGNATELTSIAAPSALFLRCDENRSNLYVFHYLDVYGERRQDSWHRWEYNSALGPIIGVSPTADGLLVFTVRRALKADASGYGLWVVADLQPMTPGLSDQPYLDSLRTWDHISAGPTDRSVNPATLGDWAVAFDGTTDYRFFGGTLQEGADLLTEFPLASGLMGGCSYSSYFTPTYPLVLDKNGVAITTGRLTVTRLAVSYADTSGFSAEVTANKLTDTQEFNGRILGDEDNLIDREPVTTGQVSVIVGREARDYTLTLHARDWFPFNITSLEWVGQFFNRTQRM